MLEVCQQIYNDFRPFRQTSAPDKQFPKPVPAFCCTGFNTVALGLSLFPLGEGCVHRALPYISLIIAIELCRQLLRRTNRQKLDLDLPEVEMADACRELAPSLVPTNRLQFRQDNAL